MTIKFFAKPFQIWETNLNMAKVIVNCLRFLVQSLCYYIVTNSTGKVKSYDLVKGRRSGNFDENITYVTDY